MYVTTLLNDLFDLIFEDWNEFHKIILDDFWLNYRVTESIG